jgi:hypothetical protein
MAMAAILSVGTDDRLVLRSHYDPDLVDALKEAIPYAYREWDKTSKVWRIDPDWGDVAVQVLKDRGATVIDKRPPVATAAVVPPQLQEACARLCITPDAPLVVAEAAYKAWARLKHPDVGGDTETMQQLNDAIATFKAFNEVPF